MNCPHLTPHEAIRRLTAMGRSGAPSPTPISHPRGAHLVFHAHVFAANLLLLQLLLLLLQLYIIYS
jgi:hypothetical protein